jgi:predicted RNase H-like HicB family nuclease
MEPRKVRGVYMNKMLYPIFLRWSDEDKLWIAEVPDLPGCLAHGESREAALKAAEEAQGLWLEVATEEGREIPPPSEDASGKFLVRLPKSLHRRLQHLAKLENVSLNQLVLSLLAEKSRPSGDRR